MIGVGITTRNRPEVLDYTLSQFMKFADKNQDIIVVDDYSDDKAATWDIINKYGIDMIENDTRLGIAKSKNELIKEFANHEGMVIFDDDCFPTQEGWYEHFLRAFKNHKQHHTIYAREPQIMLSKRFAHADVWMGCLGVCIWLSKYAVQKVGGWDPRFGIYGVEHHELTGRCYRAGLSPLGHYVSPREISNYIWCFDTDGDHVLCDCGYSGKYERDCPACGDPLILNEDGFKWIHRGCMDDKEKETAIAENVKIAGDMVREQNKKVFRDIW